MAIYFPPGLFIEWMGPVSVFGFAAMGVDKLLATERLSRVSERTLWLAALVGGFLGIIAGGIVFHHKTSEPEFWGPVGVATVLWVAVAILAARPQVQEREPGQLHLPQSSRSVKKSTP